MVFCSGSLCLYHLCEGQGFLSSDCLCMAFEFFHLSLLAFMIENGANNNGKDNSFELFCLIKLLFIYQLDLVIYVLFHILKAKKLIKTQVLGFSIS